MVTALHARPRGRPRVGAARLLLPVVALVLASGVPHAQTPPAPTPKSSPAGRDADALRGSSPNRKLNRQLDIFERILDDVLVDSRHALVTTSRNVSGAYLPGHGAVFAFEFGLVGPDWGGGAFAFGGRGFRMFGGDDDDYVSFYDDDDEDDDGSDRDDDRAKGKDKKEKKRRHIRIHRSGGRDGEWFSDLDDDDLKEVRTRQYRKVKEELVDTLAENGDLFDGLGPDEWVALIARPRDGSWGDEKVKRLVIRARKRDLADRAEGRTDDAAFRGKLVIEEYN